MKIPLLPSIPNPLLIAFVVMFGIGAIIFVVSLVTGKAGHEGYWTAFALHGVAEFWGFTLAGLVTFVIAVKLADEKIKSVIKLVAQLRKNSAIKGETARGVVICAAKIFSEEKLTKDLSTSIKPEEATCRVCILPFETRTDFRCPHCGLQDHYWQFPGESKT